MLLAINTCLRRVEVALIDEVAGEILYEKSEVSERDHTEKIFEFIKDAIEGSDKADMRKPDKILVVTGPGAFTSIRVGVVTANTIAFALRAEGAPSQLYAIDLKSLFDEEEKKAPLYLSVGKSEIYKYVRRTSSAKVAEISEDEFVKKDAEEFFKTVTEEFYGDIREDHISLMKNKKLLLNRKFSFGTAILKIVKSGKLDTYEVAQSLPTYLKAPNISVSKKEI